jgi:hypothetical protein
MLTLLDEIGELDAVAARLSNEYRRPRAEMLTDLDTLCRDLLSRGLIEATT